MPAAGSRPGPVVDPRPQEWVLQHTVEHADAICPFVQILDAPAPQMGEQLVHFFRFLDPQLPVEQVIDVPKISDDINRAWLTAICVIPRLRNSWWQCQPSCPLPRSSSRLSSISSTFQFRVVVGAQVVEVVDVFKVLQRQNPAALVDCLQNCSRFILPVRVIAAL